MRTKISLVIISVLSTFTLLAQMPQRGGGGAAPAARIFGKVVDASKKRN